MFMLAPILPLCRFSRQASFDAVFVFYPEGLHSRATKLDAGSVYLMIKNGAVCLFTVQLLATSLKPSFLRIIEGGILLSPASSQECVLAGDETHQRALSSRAVACMNCQAPLPTCCLVE